MNDVEAELVSAVEEGDPTRNTYGVVSAISPALTVTVGASTVAVAATPLGSYRPRVGDYVAIIERGADRLVLGNVGTLVGIGSVATPVSTIAAQNGVGTSPTDLSNLAISFTAPGNRRYRITGQALARQRTVLGVPKLQVYETNGASIVQTVAATAGIDEYVNLTAIGTHVPAAGARVYRLRGYTSASTVDFHGIADHYGILMVEDIGPA